MEMPKYIVFRVDVMRKGTSVELTNVTDEVEDVILKADRKTEPTISKMEQVDDEPQTDNGIGCSRCESRYGCYDRDMPHAVHCNNYGKITDEPQMERSE